MIQLGGGGGGGGGEDNIIFQCLSADCKVVHEFIGNYFTERSFTEKTNKIVGKSMILKRTKWEVHKR